MRSAAKTASVPSWLSIDMAAATSAVSSSIDRSCRASSSIPSMPSVPLMSARPSFSRRTSGSMPARRAPRPPSTTVSGRVAHLALPHRGERDMRKRREVARAAERAVLAHDRGDSGVEHRRVGLGDDRAHARVAGRQRLQPQQLQRAHDLAFHLGAGAGCVRADQARLQLGAALRRDERGRERAEAGRDSVVRLGIVGESLDERAGCRDPLERGGVEHHAGAVPSDGDDIVGAQGCADRRRRRGVGDGGHGFDSTPAGSRADRASWHPVSVMPDNPV